MNFKSLVKQAIFVLRNKISKPQKPFVFVAIGDSTVEGIGASTPERNFASLIFSFIKQDIKNAELHNLGEAGARVEDVLLRQLDKAIELNPDLIVLSVGANDLMQRRRLKTFEREFQELIDRLSKTKALIAVNNVPDLSLAPVVPKVAMPYCLIQIPRFNEVIKKHTRKHGHILVDLYSQSKLFKGYTELISSDGLHPSDAGYALWANTIITKLQPVLTNTNLERSIFNIL